MWAGGQKGWTTNENNEIKKKVHIAYTQHVKDQNSVKTFKCNCGACVVIKEVTAY